jgi:hypothetical protein
MYDSTKVIAYEDKSRYFGLERKDSKPYNRH